LGYADMLWITAAIEALEKAVAASSSVGLEIVQLTSTHTTTIAAITQGTQSPPLV
jgi:hypothetical protein